MVSLNFTVLLVVPIIVLVAMGNVLVIIAVALEKNLQSATNCFLSSLAVADLLVALTVMPPSLAMIVNNYKWPFNDDFCGVWVMLDVFFSTSSILHLCMLSFDRYMALAKPFRHRGSQMPATSTKLGIFSQNNPKALKRVARRIAFVWTVAFGIALPIPIIGKTNRSNLFYEKMCTINVAEFQIYGSIAAFFMPLVFMFVMYTLTIKILRQQAHMVSNLLVYNPKKSSPSSNRENSVPRRRGSAQLGSEKYLNRVYTGSQFQKRKSAVATEENEPNSLSILSSCPSPVVMAKTRKCKFCISEIQKRRSCCACLSTFFRSFIETACRLKLFSHFRREQSENKRARKGLVYKERCTCTFEKEVIEVKDRRRSSVLSMNKFQRNSRSSTRRISSSFKNKAMTSITSEQRASKVLGLIFVLFCLFWCPFFFTNVLSRLCLQCDQNLIGELMKWFVWVGYVSSGVNPCVYTLFSRRFRRTFYLLIRCQISCSDRGRCGSVLSRRGSMTGSFWSNAKFSKQTTTSAAFLREVNEADELESLPSTVLIPTDKKFGLYEEPTLPLGSATPGNARPSIEPPKGENVNFPEQLQPLLHMTNSGNLDIPQEAKRYRRNNSVDEFLRNSPLLRSIVQDFFKASEENNNVSSRKLQLNENVPCGDDDKSVASRDSVCSFLDPSNSLSHGEVNGVGYNFELSQKKLNETFTQNCIKGSSNISKSEDFKGQRLLYVNELKECRTAVWHTQSFFGLRRQSC